MELVKKEKLFDCAATVIVPYKCGQCQNFENIFLGNVKRHISEGHKTCILNDPQYKCTNCNFGTYSQYLLMRHKLFEKCKQDNRKNSPVVDESDVLNFILKSTVKKERIFSCNKCHYKTNQRPLLTKHKMEEHKSEAEQKSLDLFAKLTQDYLKKMHQSVQENTRNSPVVDESDVSNSNLNSTIEKERTFSCNKCRYKTNQKQILTKHITEEHMSEDKEKCHDLFDKRRMQQSVQKQKLFDCTTANIMPYKCGKCVNSTNHFLGNMKQHISKGHGLYVLEHPLYNCTNCNFVTYSQYLILRHSFAKNNPVTDESDVLNFIFNNKNKKGKIFSCNECDYETSQKCLLKDHIIRKHVSDNEKKWLQCAYCDYKTIIRFQLKMHTMSKHTSEDEKKWYQCQHCKYKALTRYRLKMHIKLIHDEKKWFQCEHCSYKIRNSQCFKKHVAQHTLYPTSKNWLKCELCEYTTVWKNCMRSHVISKHVPDEKKEELHCEYCEYTTLNKKTLRAHKARKHKYKT